MRGEGVAPKYLAACVVVFVLAMAAFYVLSLSAPEAVPTSSAAPVTAESAKPWKAPPQKKKKRSRTTSSSSFSGSSRSTSDLSLDSTEESWSPTAHRIEGRVVGERGRPVPGARVTYRTDGKRRTTKADESGVFSITARGRAQGRTPDSPLEASGCRRRSRRVGSRPCARDKATRWTRHRGGEAPRRTPSSQCRRGRSGLWPRTPKKRHHS